MPAMGVHDQIKKAFQDLIAPELHARRGEIRSLDQKIDHKIDGLRVEMSSMKSELLAEIRRLDARMMTGTASAIEDGHGFAGAGPSAGGVGGHFGAPHVIDGMDRELRTAIEARRA
jgi:hypothetical protein